MGSAAGIWVMSELIIHPDGWNPKPPMSGHWSHSTPRRLWHAVVRTSDLRRAGHPG